ncbi:MAG: hypothetical protein CNIPEHKO_03027 [Anaerolineales bacterium]|nr:hypothetical protein [Anaerolineales bacterium]
MQTRDRGFDFEDVLRRFDEQDVHAASNQTFSLFGERGDQLIVCDVRQVGVIGGGKFAARSNGASDEAGMRGYRIRVTSHSFRTV